MLGEVNLLLGIFKSRLCVSRLASIRGATLTGNVFFVFLVSNSISVFSSKVRYNLSRHYLSSSLKSSCVYLLLLTERFYLSDDVFLVELLCPSFRDSVLDFVFHGDFVGTASQSLWERLFVQLVKLLVELGDHVLDAWAFLLLVQLVVNCDFYVFLGVESLLHLSCVGFFLKYFTNLCACVILKQNEVLVVDLVELVVVYVYVTFTLKVWLLDIATTITLWDTDLVELQRSVTLVLLEVGLGG